MAITVERPTTTPVSNWATSAEAALRPFRVDLDGVGRDSGDLGADELVDVAAGDGGRAVGPGVAREGVHGDHVGAGGNHAAVVGRHGVERLSSVSPQVCRTARPPRGPCSRRSSSAHRRRGGRGLRRTGARRTRGRRRPDRMPWADGSVMCRYAGKDQCMDLAGVGVWSSQCGTATPVRPPRPRRSWRNSDSPRCGSRRRWAGARLGGPAAVVDQAGGDRHRNPEPLSARPVRMLAASVRITRPPSTVSAISWGSASATPRSSNPRPVSIAEPLAAHGLP